MRSTKAGYKPLGRDITPTLARARPRLGSLNSSGKSLVENGEVACDQVLKSFDETHSNYYLCMHFAVAINIHTLHNYSCLNYPHLATHYTAKSRLFPHTHTCLKTNLFLVSSSTGALHYSAARVPLSGYPSPYSLVCICIFLQQSDLTIISRFVSQDELNSVTND